MNDPRDPLASMAQMFLMIVDVVAPPGRRQETREVALKMLQDMAAGRPLPAPAPLLNDLPLPVRTVPDVQPTPATVYPFAEYQVTRDHT